MREGKNLFRLETWNKKKCEYNLVLQSEFSPFSQSSLKLVKRGKNRDEIGIKFSRRLFQAHHTYQT